MLYVQYLAFCLAFSFKFHRPFRVNFHSFKETNIAMFVPYSLGEAIRAPGKKKEQAQEEHTSYNFNKFSTISYPNWNLRTTSLHERS